MPVCRRSKSMRPRRASEVFVICAEIEQEIAELDDDEKKHCFWRIWA